MPPKAKTSSSDRVVCSCGCGEVLSRRTQTRHLQGCGPTTAVAGIIEARAYFRKRSIEDPESPRPRKRQRHQVSGPNDDTLSTRPIEEAPGDNPQLDAAPPDPLSPPALDPTPESLAISQATCNALSTPWTGPADFRDVDGEVFDDSNDAGIKTAQPAPVTAPTEPESSDTDSEAGGDGIGPDGADEEPDVFETHAELNTAEYSESTDALIVMLLN